MGIYSALFLGFLLFLCVLDWMRHVSEREKKSTRRNLFKPPGRQLPKRPAS